MWTGTTTPAAVAASVAAAAVAAAAAAAGSWVAFSNSDCEDSRNRRTTEHGFAVRCCRVVHSTEGLMFNKGRQYTVIKQPCLYL